MKGHTREEIFSSQLIMGGFKKTREVKYIFMEEDEGKRVFFKPRF